MKTTKPKKQQQQKKPGALSTSLSFTLQRLCLQ